MVIQTVIRATLLIFSKSYSGKQSVTITLDVINKYLEKLGDKLSFVLYLTLQYAFAFSV